MAIFVQEENIFTTGDGPVWTIKEDIQKDCVPLSNKLTAEDIIELRLENETRIENLEAISESSRKIQLANIKRTNSNKIMEISYLVWAGITTQSK